MLVFYDVPTDSIATALTLSTTFHFLFCFFFFLRWVYIFSILCLNKSTMDWKRRANGARLCGKSASWRRTHINREKAKKKQEKDGKKGRTSHVRWFEQTKIESTPNKQSTVFRVLSDKFNCKIGFETMRICEHTFTQNKQSSQNKDKERMEHRNMTQINKQTRNQRFRCNIG